MNACIIPARGGSKSIPLKNILEVGGKPLIWWSLNAAQNSNLDKIYVSTDSDKIKEVVESFNFNKVEVIGRSDKVSSDTATTESVMVEFFRHFYQNRFKFNTITLIQATSPLIKKEYINESLNKLLNDGWDSVLSVVREYAFQWKENSEGILEPQYDPFNRPRRQDYNGRLTENGALYITTSEAFKNSGCRVSGNITYYEMPNHTLYEIDEPNDIIIIEKLLEKHG